MTHDIVSYESGRCSAPPELKITNWDKHHITSLIETDELDTQSQLSVSHEIIPGVNDECSVQTANAIDHDSNNINVVQIDAPLTGQFDSISSHSMSQDALLPSKMSTLNYIKDSNYILTNTNDNKNAQIPKCVKQHNSDTTSSSSNSTTVRRQRHSIAGQMSYFKMLAFGGYNKKMATSANSLFSTAVISGSSSAPNLRDMIPVAASPSGKISISLHSIQFQQISVFHIAVWPSYIYHFELMEMLEIIGIYL